jgi:hypothetical protein
MKEGRARCKEGRKKGGRTFQDIISYCFRKGSHNFIIKVATAFGDQEQESSKTSSSNLTVTLNPTDQLLSTFPSYLPSSLSCDHYSTLCLYKMDCFRFHMYMLVSLMDHYILYYQNLYNYYVLFKNQLKNRGQTKYGRVFVTHA